MSEAAKGLGELASHEPEVLVEDLIDSPGNHVRNASVVRLGDPAGHLDLRNDRLDVA